MVFVARVSGSFYGRLLPRNSLHFINSCYSLHWLSQVPPGLIDHNGRPINKGKMCISETSPSDVAIAYTKQFQQDFNIFLKSRSEELICGGRMVLTILGRKTIDHNDKRTNFLWDCCLNHLQFWPHRSSRTPLTQKQISFLPLPLPESYIPIAMPPQTFNDAAKKCAAVVWNFRNTHM